MGGEVQRAGLGENEITRSKQKIIDQEERTDGISFLD
jgi:hypothetical protein